MSELVVVAFPGDPDGADLAAEALERIGDSGSITPDDAVLVDVDTDGKLALRQAFSLTGERVIDGVLLGGAVGAALTLPFGPIGPLAWLAVTLGGAAIGAATGAYIGSHRDYGIPDEFVTGLGDALAPGSSALFVMVPDEQGASAMKLLEPTGGDISMTCLDTATEEKLHEAMKRASAHGGGGA